MKTHRRLIAAAGTLLMNLSLAFAASPAQSQPAWPTKPIRWIVPSPPGSPIDSIARKLAEPVSLALGGNIIIIDNKPGAMGTIGVGEMVRAKPDGYTFAITINDPTVGATAVLKSVPYDTSRDIAYISKIAANGPALVASPSMKANNLTELVAELKGHPEGIAYGSWGAGSLPAQITETFARESGVKVIEIPYKGAPPALVDLLGNRISLTYASPHQAVQMANEGKLKILAVAANKRSPLLPNVPTFAESGFKSFVFTNEVWVGMLASAQVAPEIQQTMASAVQKALREPAMKKFLADIGFDAIGNTPAEFTKEHAAEIAVIPDLIRGLGVKPE